MPKEIKIEVTATISEATTRVVVDGKELSKRTMRRASSGLYRGTEKGDVFGDLPDWMDDIAEVAEDIDDTTLIRLLREMN